MDIALELLLAQEDGDSERVAHLTDLLHEQNKKAHMLWQARQRCYRQYGQPTTPPRDMR